MKLAILPSYFVLISTDGLLYKLRLVILSGPFEDILKKNDSSKMWDVMGR